MFERTRRARVGVVGIRVLAGGALSGVARRHSAASPEPEPVGSALSYKADLGRAARLMPLVAEEFAVSLPEATIRFAIAHPAMGTILVGMASVDEFETALAAVLKGPLPAAARRRTHRRLLGRKPLIEPAPPCVKALKQPSDGTRGAGGPSRTGSACPDRAAGPDVAAGSVLM